MIERPERSWQTPQSREANRRWLDCLGVRRLGRGLAALKTQTRAIAECEMRARVGLVSLLMVVAGCAQMPSPSWTWRKSPREMPGPNTLAGRVASVEAIGERVAGISATEARRMAEDWSSQWTAEGEMPVPVKTSMLRVAAQFPEGAGLPVVRLGIADTLPDVRARACRAAGEMGSPEAMELLVETLSTEQETEVRLAATRALGQFPDPRVVDTLGRLLDDRDPAIQYLAMQSLESATGEDAGMDVRQWKKRLESPASLTAGGASDKLRR